MDRDKQESVLKDLKTTVKFLRIANKMSDNINNDIAEENDKSIIVNRLDNYVQTLGTTSEGWNDFLYTVQA